MNKFSSLVAIAVTLWSVLASVHAAAQEEEHAFAGNSQCKLCHNKPAEGAQWAVWKKMTHAKAFEVLSGEQAVAIGKELGLEKPPSESASCLKCHVTGYDEKTEAVPAKIKMADGVQCDSCHGPSAAHLVDGKAIRMKKAKDLDILANIVRPDGKTCVKCHNEENPTWDPARYKLENGETSGFDFKQAYKKIEHPNPKKAFGKKK